MSGLKGDLRKLSAIKAALKRLPVVTAQKIAAQAAPSLSGLAHTAYTSGQTVYGDTRPTGAHGPVTLMKSGKTLASLSFVAIGTIIRARLGTPWAKFLVGKFRILPIGTMPVSWSKDLAAKAATVIKGELP